MKTSLMMDFTVDKTTNTVNVKREFAAPVADVWAAWTEQELLDRWWAPKPWKSRTKSMDFKVGGRRLYAMVGPKDEEHWALADFKSIAPKNNFKFLDAFCDNTGKINEDFPRSDWNLDFSKAGENTLVEVKIKHKNLADLEKTIEMGFKEGFSIAMDGLDEIFVAKRK